jgi:hypothetical protein
MISALQSCEFGFGLKISEEQLKEVSKYREGKHYMDKEAPKSKRGSTSKGALTRSPFVVEFNYGTQEQGYWNYEHMVLQLEDCVDCLKVLLPEYDYLFLFDHSCGHNRQRENGLNVERMLKSYGGKQAILRDTLIKQEKGYLGTHLRTLRPGDIQKMAIQDSDDSPFWMTPIEREQRRFDIILPGTKVRRFTKAELLVFLQEKGVSARGKLSDLVVAAENHGIPVREEVQKIQKGWIGKAKGLIQVAYERGLIDIENNNAMKKYTTTGRKDEFGNVLLNTLLKHIISSCTDFEEELMMLQTMGQSMGVMIDRTPNCHCEITGEGIEYSWALAKNHFRQILLEEKRGKEKFLAIVIESVYHEQQ